VVLLVKSGAKLQKFCQTGLANSLQMYNKSRGWWFYAEYLDVLYFRERVPTGKTNGLKQASICWLMNLVRVGYKAKAII